MEKNYQLPSNIVSTPFGEVNVRANGDCYEILATILMEPSGKEAEGWKTGIALDASTSLRWAYGKTMKGTIPDHIQEEYKRKGWVTTKTIDGLSVHSLSSKAKQDAFEKGYLHYSENIIQSLARNFITYLATNLDSYGKTLVSYWACNDGSQFEVLGEFDAEQCSSLELAGPQKTHFGNGTYLLPILKEFRNRLATAKRSMAIFLTDGKLDDFEEVKEYSIKMAHEVEAGKCNFMKCVLIGVGDKISEEQMSALDDLETGTDVDIWDHKIAKEMRSLIEIFAEVVDENQLIAANGSIVDDKNNVVKTFPDGVPAKISFSIPITSKSFTLKICDYAITQPIEYYGE